MRGRGKAASQTMSQMVSCGLQLAPLALLLLHDQDYKAWCHGGHGTTCSPYVNIVLTAHSSPRLATAASTRGCGRLTSHSAGDQKKLSQRLPSVWGRWEAGWDYYHYRFTGISAPRSSTCLSGKLECAEVVTYIRSVALLCRAQTFFFNPLLCDRSHCFLCRSQRTTVSLDVGRTWTCGFVRFSIRGISDDPNGSLVSNVVAMAAPRRAAAMCESGESQFFIVRSTISSESGFPATQSNRTHSQITQLVESHDWGEHAGKSWTTLEG